MGNITIYMYGYYHSKRIQNQKQSLLKNQFSFNLSWSPTGPFCRSWHQFSVFSALRT